MEIPPKIMQKLPISGEKYCLENNIKIIYNPPCSPEFNTIELIFNKVKTEYKKLDHKNIKDKITGCLKKQLIKI